MKAYPMLQRSALWLQSRVGKVTASRADSIVTPGGQLSKQSEKYRNELLAEMWLGHPLETMQTQYMIRGVELEDEAVEAFEMLTGKETSPGGFFTNDSGTIGASPDRLIDRTGVLEIKAPAAQTHLGYLLSQSMEAYKPQTQMQLWICEREYVSIVSYYPGLPAMIAEVGRDEKYIAILSAAVEQFVSDLLEKRRELEQRYGPFPDPMEMDDKPPWREDDLISEADLETVLRLRREGAR